MKRIALVMAATALASACAQNPPPPPPVMPAVDVTSPLYGPTFLQIASSANQLEIQSSQLALQMSQNAAVRSFAQMIIADHQQLGAQMAAAAAAGGLTMPPPGLSPDDQAKLSALQAAGPGGFDMAYRDMQVAAHQQAIGLFQNYATGGDNPSLRAAAGQSLPALQKHLATAQALVVTPPMAQPPLPPRPGERG